MATIEFLTAARLIVLDAAAIAPAESGLAPTLLDAVRAARLPLGQSCRGEGVCRSCGVDIPLGADALSPLTALETRFGFGPARRLACQVVVPTAAVRVRLHHPSWGLPPAPVSSGPSGPELPPGSSVPDRPSARSVPDRPPSAPSGPDRAAADGRLET
ncbi:MAG TPA: 2Fe-2S iron-sulfur cluster-binding protein [Nannocystis sp.]